MSGPTVDDSAATADPSINTHSSTIAIRRLPYISPNLPEIGVQIAATNSVMVMTQAVLPLAVFSSCGSSPWMGMRMVWVNAAVMPANARAATIQRDRDVPTATPGCGVTAVGVSIVIKPPFASRLESHRTDQ